LKGLGCKEDLLKKAFRCLFVHELLLCFPAAWPDGKFCVLLQQAAASSGVDAPSGGKIKKEDQAWAYLCVSQK
jgi:hypothetical protein